MQSFQEKKDNGEISEKISQIFTFKCSQKVMQKTCLFFIFTLLVSLLRFIEYFI